MSDQTDDTITCPTCDGTGVIEVYASMDPAAKLVEECCPKCDGRGYLYQGEAA